MDNISKEERSQVMKKVQSKDTKPELMLRHKLWAMGLRYRKNCRTVMGHPDLYCSKYKCAVFVHGCFWHRHNNCKNTRTPKSNIDFWEKKFDSNVKRDNLVRESLNSMGIRVIVVWECSAEKMLKPKNKEMIIALLSEITEGTALYREF